MMSNNLNKNIWSTFISLVLVIIGIIVISISTWKIFHDELFVEQWVRIQKEYMWYNISGALLVFVPYITLLFKSKK